MTAGPSSDKTIQSSHKNRFQLPTQNCFAPLESVEPEYSSLAYLDVEICYPGAKEWNTTRAMLDCGGQGSFINREFCQVYQIPQVLKPTPLPLILADGQSSRGGDVTHYTPLLLNIAGNAETIALDTSMTAHDIILGIPWLNKHNPSINWGSSPKTFTFNSPYCKDHCAHYGRTIELHDDPLPPSLTISNPKSSTSSQSS